MDQVPTLSGGCKDDTTGSLIGYGDPLLKSHKIASSGKSHLHPFCVIPIRIRLSNAHSPQLLQQTFLIITIIKRRFSPVNIPQRRLSGKSISPTPLVVRFESPDSMDEITNRFAHILIRFNLISRPQINSPLVFGRAW